MLRFLSGINNLYHLCKKSLSVYHEPGPDHSGSGLYSNRSIGKSQTPGFREHATSGKSAMSDDYEDLFIKDKGFLYS